MILLSPRHGIFIILDQLSKFSTPFPVHHEETILDQSSTNIFITYECCNERLSTIPRKYNKYKDNRALLYLPSVPLLIFSSHVVLVTISHSFNKIISSVVLLDLDGRGLALYLCVLVLYVELDSLIQQVLLYALYGLGCEIFIRWQLREGETVGLGVPTLGLERSW